jgi:PPIC-type PPIASE domain
VNKSIIREVCLGLAGLGIIGVFGGVANAQQTATAAAPGPAATSPASNSRVVMKVGGEEVTEADMQMVMRGLSPQQRQAMAQQGSRQLADQYAVMIALAQKGATDHLDNTLAFQRQLAFEKRQLLAQAEFEQLANNIKISPEEASQYYTAHQAEYEEAQVRFIVIRKKADNAPAGSAGLPEADAKSKAQAIKQAFAAPEADPKKILDQFQTADALQIDPEPRTIHRGQFPNKEIENAAFALSDGQISDVIDLAQVLVMVQKVSHKTSPLGEVTPEIEKQIKQEKVQALLADLKSKASIWEDEAYFAPAAKPSAAPTAPEAAPAAGGGAAPKK